ncbi:hypothetical protein HO133_000928 [Letharia lupina]|uniref:Major facilitator superfamily (MFS) profile domain-containing protein n=1 Tax=Letharia lupina TaxID=560253 RepID=A0A8H6FC13_9LECA|nr:uncharacterized protein HO133_000928 [Letharia lupina]KAF6222877.1 hypothetical protein HO133_000928 [Letharia lupina]
MASKEQLSGLSLRPSESVPGDQAEAKTPFWKRMLGGQEPASSGSSVDQEDGNKGKPEKWSMGVLNDRQTDEVPGSILLMSNTKHNEPLGLRNAPARTSASSLPSPFPPSSGSGSARPSSRRQLSGHSVEEKKKTKDGKIILEPQPEESMNDPLNWPSWRRDVALLSLGFYCMLGGGMTPVLAAGFKEVAATYDVSIPQVALTTGLYMMGLGVGSVVFSPTAILFGKRPVYLVGIVLFIVSAVWCAVSPNYASLVVARVFMGLAVSPVECLPSATIAEIFYLHERAYRLGIYTLLLLSGKNLIPLVSAAIIQGLSWRWVFWIVAMVVGFCFVLMFLFVPETFWDRTPRPRSRILRPGLAGLSRIFHHTSNAQDEKGGLSAGGDGPSDMRRLAIGNSASAAGSGRATIAERRQQRNAQHVGFADQAQKESEDSSEKDDAVLIPESKPQGDEDGRTSRKGDQAEGAQYAGEEVPRSLSPASHKFAARIEPRGEGPQTPGLHNFNSPFYVATEKPGTDYLKNEHEGSEVIPETPGSTGTNRETAATSVGSPVPGPQRYTTYLRTQPAKTYAQTLKPWNGKLRHENWLKVAIRPFILFAYPSILWSTLVYSLSIGWLIVLSESVSTIFENKATYNFTPLQAGLVYVSPFIGGVLGTAVAGKVSDLIVRYMSRRNGGVYEPEFRLVMAIPVTIATCIGLMGYGWSAQERDNWIVPTVFFGIISFGCALGSTTSITFAVDSYRQYAGEALVTLNFSKNIFHGLVFSLFFNRWLDADGMKNTFVAIGGIQLACLTTTVPMYIFGKRARMWTVRKNFMEKF